MKSQKHFCSIISALALAVVASTAQATTINIDEGTTYTKLSEVVAAVYADEDGQPDVINLNVNSLANADTQILLDKPITINGDGNNDNIRCDLLVNMTGIQGEGTVGDAGKSYIEISAIGDVQINNLQIHPNGNGAFNTTDADLVTGIRMKKPTSGVGNYTLTEVHVSGSTSADAYIPLDTGDDLYATADKKWGGTSGGDGAIINYGVIQLTNGGGAGIYNSTLDNCHAGLGFGTALNILPQNAGTHTVLGGVYGHVGRDGIHIDGQNVSIKGTHEDRLRIVRATNIGAANSHCLEVVNAAATVPLIEYVDTVGVNTANNFALRGGTIGLIQYCRGFGKMEAGRNETVFFAGSNVTEISNCTFHGNGTEVGTVNGLNPMSITGGVTNPVIIKDSIFTSLQNGSINLAPTTASLVVNFTNCALPTDGFAGESLSAWPFIGAGGATVVAPVSTSPDYRLTLEDYDWSDNQGHNMPDNARGNLNVLRPTSAAYSGASSTLGQLNGGAGAPAAGIEESVWMLM